MYVRAAATRSHFVLVALVLLAALAWAGGCGGEVDDGHAARVEAAPPPEGGFVGTWKMQGLTKDLAKGDTRRIEGVVVLHEEEGGAYIGSSDLETQYPSQGGAIDAHVIGTSEGRLEGNVLLGKAENQLVLGTVPGVHAEFAFVPRQVGPRIASEFKSYFRADGRLVLESENKPAPGETRYSPTRTTLYGTRMPDVSDSP